MKQLERRSRYRILP